MNGGSGRVPVDDVARQANRVFSLAASSELVDADEDTITALPCLFAHSPPLLSLRYRVVDNDSWVYSTGGFTVPSPAMKQLAAGLCAQGEQKG